MTKTEKIQELLNQEWATRDIAREVHCSLSSIQKVRRGEVLRTPKVVRSRIDSMKKYQQEKEMKQHKFEVELALEDIIDKRIIPALAEQLHITELDAKWFIVQYHKAYQREEYYYTRSAEYENLKSLSISDLKQL